MKKLVTALALATLVASPAFAKTANGSSAYAQAPRGEVMSSQSNVVTDENGHVQADPDLNIRSQLQRENPEF